MTGALIFLLFKSWQNRLLMRFRRLKNPKYLLGAIIGGAYFAYLYGYRFYANSVRAQHGPHVPALDAANHAALAESVSALALFLFTLLAWLVPHERAALVFTEAEVAFLFPAPVPRRTLIHFKLIKSQIVIFFMVFFLSVFLGRMGSGGSAWLHALGWWLILSIMNLHNLGASFVRTMLLERGISNWKRRAFILSAVLLLAGGTFFWARASIPPLTGVDTDGRALLNYARQVLDSGPLPYLLYPFRVAVRPRLAEDLSGFLAALGPALLLLAAHYWWVVRSDVAFEEASVDASRKMSETLAAIRTRRTGGGFRPAKKKKPPFQLRPAGPPLVALLWKNLIAAGSMFTWRTFLICICIALPAGISMVSHQGQLPVAMFLAGLAGVLLLLTLFLGPQFIRADFRQDLPMADVLKCYPLKGWQIALGELLGPAVILTGAQWILIAAGAGLMSRWRDIEITPGSRLAIAASLAVIAPALNLLILVIPNAAVLLFPSWVQSGKDAPQGIEATGQRMIFALGQMAVLLLALVPAALVATGVYFLEQFFIGPFAAIPAAALLAAAILGAEAWLGIIWLGGLFEGLDLTEESGG